MRNRVRPGSPVAQGKSIAHTCLLLVLALGIWPSDEARGLLADRIQARLDLTAVQTESGDLRDENYRQDYNAVYTRQLLPYLNLMGSFRYFKYDVMQEEVESLWSKEMNPRAELNWKHPSFHFGAGASRRDSWALGGLGVLRTDAMNFTFRTRNPNLPVAIASYDWHRSLETGSGAPRDLLDQRLQAGISYTKGGSSLGYTQTRRLSENLLPGLETEQLDHMVRWSSSLSGLEGGRVYLSSYYTFIRSERTDRVLSAGAILERIPLLLSLYAFDTAPEFGALDELAGLSDEDTATPVDPPVDIGGDNENQNLGADLGFARPVSSAFVYTDRASSASLVWDLYTSEDNLDWTSQAASLSGNFNASLNRYEIEFAEVEARYVKVVNRGFNEVAEVLVTELEFYQALQAEEQDVTRDMQMAQLRLGVQLHERVLASVDLSMQQDPATGSVGKRTNTTYSILGRYDMSSWLRHQVKWEQSLQDFRDEGSDLLDNLASYTMLIDPLETLNATFSLAQRQNWIQGELDQEHRSASFGFRGVPAWGIEWAASVLRNQAILHASDREYATWAFRNSLGGAMTSSFDFRFTYSLRDTRTEQDDFHFRQHVWGLEGRYQLTQDIFGSARVNYVTERDDYISSDYNLTWRILPALNINGSANLSDAEGGLKSRRYSTGANYNLNRRSDLYLRYSYTDLSEAGGSKTTSFQQGFRMRF